MNQFKVDVKDLEVSVENNDHSSIFMTAHKMRSSLKIFDQDMYEQISLLEKYGAEEKDFTLIKHEYLSFNEKVQNKLPLLEQTKQKLEQDLVS